MDRSRPPAAASDAPRFALGWSALAFALAAFTLAYPALGGRFLVNPFSDQYIAGYAFREFAAEWLRSGKGFPLWNPYLFGGMPYVAAMHGDIFYPTFLLRLVLPTDAAMTWAFIIHLWFCGLFTYLFLRALGVGFYASIVGGIAYMLSGQIASLVTSGHDGKLYVSALFPLTLFLLYRGIRQGRPWTWGVLAIVIGLAALSPHPQLLQYLLLASGAFALFCAFAPLDGVRLDRPVALRRLAFALGAVVLGGAMSAVQYLPVREYVGWSPRAGGLSGYERATSFSMPPEELINTYVPQFSGILDAYWGRNGIHFHSEYLGVVALLLAGLGLGARRDDDRRRLVWFWVATGVVALLWALGGFTPFYRLIYTLVPGTKFFRAPSTIFFLVSFAVAVLAAFGAERVMAARVSTRYLLVWGVAAVLIGVIATLGGFTNLGVSIAGTEAYDVVAANQGAVTLGAWRSFLFVAIAAAVIVARLRERISPRAAAVALAALMVTDFWTILHRYWLFSPPAAQIYVADPVIEYLKAQPQPGRVIAAEVGAPQVVHDPFFEGDGLMVHHIRNALGYHGNEIGRYDVLGGKSQGWMPLFTSPRLWQLLNVHYFLTNVDSLPFAGVTRVAGPVRNAAGSMEYLFRLPGENPAAWIAPVIVKAPDDVVLATLTDPRFDDVHRAALFDTSANVTARPGTGALPPALPIKANVTRYEPGHISIRLDAPAPAGSALVVSENYYPGWTATSGGRQLPVGRADFVLIGVELPAGATDVDLVFRSAPYERGKTLTLAALAVAALVTLAGIALARRRNG